MECIKKYVMTNETINFQGKILHRIRALRGIGHVRRGEFGGFIESERNLSHNGFCWIDGNAKAFENAKIYDDAYIADQVQVSGNTKISGSSVLCDNVVAKGNSLIQTSFLWDDAVVQDDVRMKGAVLTERAVLRGSVSILNVKVGNDMVLDGSAIISSQEIVDSQRRTITSRQQEAE